MKIQIEDCEVDISSSGKRIRHVPTNRCVFCADPTVSTEELFLRLQEDILRLKTLGVLNAHQDVVCVTTVTEETLH